VPLREGIVLKAIARALVPHAGCVVTPSRAHAERSSVGGAWSRGWRWLMVVVVAGLLAATCTGQQREQPTPTSRPAALAGQRHYWPTAEWRTAPPAEAGMDPKILAVLDTNVAYHPQLRSLLVVHHGYLVYERYWNGDAHSGQEAFSVTKSFTSALVGIAWRDHHLKSLNQTVGELLATHLPPNVDPRLAKVTVRQLLTMTSGLAGDTAPDGDSDLTYRLYESRDWVRHILARKPVTKPGTTFAYSNASSHLLSAIVADTTGRSTLAFARAKIFAPLGIHTEHAFQPVGTAFPSPPEERAYQRATVAWVTDPQGYHSGFAGLKLPARDLAKLGYLYLNGGRWDGVQIVPDGYVRASTQRQSHPPPGGPFDGYGYQWWVTSDHGHPSFAAVGYGGQFIQVIPDLDLVVVITSDAENGRDDAQQLVGEAIIPAVTG
jgi:CubicO group peptidase (beta-lactamase class C family)